MIMDSHTTRFTTRFNAALFAVAEACAFWQKVPASTGQGDQGFKGKMGNPQRKSVEPATPLFSVYECI
jgi:hypothetical protein